MIEVQIIDTKPITLEISANGRLTSSGVQSVTGVYVDNTDPQNPIVNISDLEDRVESLEDILSSQSNFTGYAYAVWTGVGLIFDVFWPNYYIQGVSYGAGSGQVTLGVADPFNPRLDVIAVDADGAIVIPGDAAVDPVKPTVDPLTQLEITTIFIAAGATTPTEISNEEIYKENIEWTGATNNGTVVFNSTNDPFAGTVSVESGAFDSTHYIRFTDGVTHNKTDFSVLMFSLKLKSIWSGGTLPTYIKATFFNAGVSVSSTVAITSGSYNFSRSNTDDYQTIVVPIASFIFTDVLFDRLELTFTNQNNDGFFMDNVVLQTGAATVSPLQNTLVSIETDSGIVNADAPDDTFRLLGAGGATTSAVDKTITITQKNQAIPYANLAAFPVTGTTGVIYMAEDSNFLYRWDGATYVQVGGGSGGDHPFASFLGLYKIDTSGTTPPSGSGDIRYDSATQVSATNLYISHLTDNGMDIDLFLSLITSGALILQDANDSENYQIWAISGTPSFASSTWAFPVVLSTSNGTGTTGFPNNHEVFLASLGSGGGGGGHVIEDEGTPRTQRAALNFVGSAVTVTDDAGNDATVVTISGGTITGTDKQVLFFDGTDNPAGEAGFEYDKTTNKLTVEAINLSGETASRIVATDGSKNLDTPYTFIDDDSMATASATAVPSSESVKAYVDAQVVSESTYAKIQAIWYHLNSF
jgi:hypothetical protein